MEKLELEMIKKLKNVRSRIDRNCEPEKNKGFIHALGWTAHRLGFDEARRLAHRILIEYGVSLENSY